MYGVGEFAGLALGALHVAATHQPMPARVRRHAAPWQRTACVAYAMLEPAVWGTVPNESGKPTRA